jgi:hypothetical protein
MTEKNQAGLAVPGDGESDERGTDRPTENQPELTGNQAEDVTRPEEEPTGEGTGARAGEYS